MGGIFISLLKMIDEENIAITELQALFKLGLIRYWCFDPDEFPYFF